MPPSTTATILGHRAERRYGKILSQLAPHLEPGEVLTAYFVANTVRPLVDGIGVTNRRVLGWNGLDLGRRSPRVAVDGGEIESFTFERSTVNRLPRLVVTVRRAEPLLVGQLMSRADEVLLGEAVQQLVARVNHVGHPDAPSPPVPSTQDAVDPPSEIRTSPPTTARAAGHDEQREQIDRLLDEGVVDEDQAAYLRAVLLGRRTPGGVSDV